MVVKHPNFHETLPQVEEDYPQGAKLEEAVADALASSGGIDAAEVSVTAAGSMITLTGIVQQVEEIARAAEVARAVPGVTEVRNAITSQETERQSRGL